MRSFPSTPRVFALVAACAGCAGPSSSSPPAPAPVASTAGEAKAPPAAAAPPTAESSAPEGAPQGPLPPLPAPPVGAPGDDVTADFVVPDGLEVRVWAVTPQLHNPTNIDVDERGRIWVSEGVNYRLASRHSKPGDAYLHHEKGDRIVIVEDSDGDGVADKTKVFAQDAELQAPLGIAVLGDRVLVSESPAVYAYVDTDGDDRADKREVFLERFGGKDSDHGLHSFVGGPDGRLYFAMGNGGTCEIKDADGKVVRRPGSMQKMNGEPGSDGRLWVQGLALRVGPDGRGLEVLAENFRNNYEVAVDAFGDVWGNDNDDDGNESCRLAYVMEGGNYGFAAADGKRTWRADWRPGQRKEVAHWHAEDPGVVPPTEITGAGAPAGLTVYERGALPATWAGAILNAEAGRGIVFAHLPKRVGAGYVTKRLELLRAKPGPKARWFRPSDVVVGPDGAIYVADWFDAVVGADMMLDGGAAGRILRIAPRGFKPSVPKLDLATDTGRIQGLSSAAVHVRWRAMAALRAAGEGAVPALTKLLGMNAPVEARARALWILVGAGPAGRARVVAALEDPDPRLRVVALRALREVEGDVSARVARLVKDRDAAVRREAAIALRHTPAKVAAPLLAKLAEGYDGRDRAYLEALGIGSAGKEEAVYDLVVHGKGEGWSPRVADLAWRLHPKSAVTALRARVLANRLSPAARKQALVALAFIPDPAAAEAVVAIAEQPKHKLAADALALALPRAGDEWVAHGLAPRVLAALERARESGALASAFSTPAPPATKDEPDAAPATPGELPALPELLALKGDPARGKRVFFGTRAGCVRCHEHGGAGGTLGPPLTRIGDKLDRAGLLEAILHPSAGIAYGYEAWAVQTKDQQVYTGLLLAEGASVLMREATGEPRLVPASEIIAREKQEISLMPDGLAYAVPPQHLMDLVEFLARSVTPAPGPAGKRAR